MPRETVIVRTRQTFSVVALVSLIFGAFATGNLAFLRAQEKSAVDQDYEREELRTLPPAVAHLPLFQKFRAHLDAIKAVIDSAAAGALSMSEIKKINDEVRESNLAIETNP